MLLGPVPLDSTLGVSLYASDTILVFESRGFASPRLTNIGKVRISRTNSKDSVCVTVTGALMPRGCAL